MEESNCLYIVNEQLPRPAFATLKKNRLEISLRNESAEITRIYWAYDTIRFSTVMDTLKAEFPGYPFQAIHTSNEELKQALTKKLKSVHSGLRKWLSAGQLTAIKIFGSILLLLAILYFWFLPFLADRFAAKMPKQYEVQFGERLWNELSIDLQIDTLRSRQLYLFFEEMKIDSDYPIQLNVVRGSEVNAFALPGGHIVLYDGLLNRLGSYQELAAVLAHEFSHVQNRHTTRSLARAYAGALFISIIGGNARGMMGYLSSQVAGLQNLSYSRSLEKEADLEAVRLLSRRQVDLIGFIDLFTVLEKAINEQGRAEPIEWISSHPDLEKRKTYIKTDRQFQLQHTSDHPALQDLFSVLQSTK